MKRRNTKKLLHLITTFSVGGAEMHLLSLVKGLPKDKYDITVAFFKEEAQEARSLVPDFKALGVKVVNLKMKSRFDILALWRIYWLMRKGKFQILHTHLFRADIYGCVLGRLAGIPNIICSVHSVGRLGQAPLPPLLLRIPYTMADAIIAISSAVEDWLISQIKLSSWKVRKIYYGIDFKRFQTDETARSNLRHELGIEKDKFLIGTVGRLSIEKGHPYLIQALSQVKREIPQTHLLLVGHEDEGLRNELENLIDKLHLRENVTLAGYRDDIPAVMHAIDVFALPSLSEGLGLVLLEAMAAGKPIVATRVGAIPEIVVEGKTAILVPPADSNCLAEAIVNMLNQPLQAKKMGEEGKTYVATHFTIESMVKRTITTYEKRTQIEVGCIKKKVT